MTVETKEELVKYITDDSVSMTKLLEEDSVIYIGKENNDTVESQKAIAANMESEQILHFGFEGHNDSPPLPLIRCTLFRHDISSANY